MLPPPSIWFHRLQLSLFTCLTKYLCPDKHTYHTSPQSIKTFLWPVFLTRGSFYQILRLDFFLRCLNPLNEREEGDIGNLGKNTQLVCLGAEGEGKLELAEMYLRRNWVLETNSIEFWELNWVWTKLNLNRSSGLWCSAVNYISIVDKCQDHNGLAKNVLMVK